MKQKQKNSSFRRHFRIYFRNNHPAYIVDEEWNMYIFHRVTHSKTSGGRKNWEKKESNQGRQSANENSKKAGKGFQSAF